MARSLSSIMLKGLTGFSATSPLRTVVVAGLLFKCDRKWSTAGAGDSDTHEDFQPTNKLSSSAYSVQDIVGEDVQKHPVMIYMKGIPDAPQCGFSALAVRVLKEYGVPIHSRNILQDQELKNGVKAFSNWPTFPQIFIKGEFIGGSDIILNMHQTGELKEKLKDLTIEASKQKEA